MKKFVLASLLASFLLAEGVMVGSAGGYKKPMIKIVEDARAQGVKVDPTFGHPKQMLAQVVADGKDYGIVVGDDLFLKKQKEVKISEFKTLGKGVLVFVSNKDVKSLNEIPNLKVAYPQPKKTIYGKCAAQTLESLNLKPKESLEVGFVPQVSTYVKNGDVDAGFINLTEAIAQKGNFKTQIIVPENLYKVPNIVAAVLPACEGNKECDKFLNILTNEKSSKIFKSYGL